jgi:hypothetical protein
MAIAMRIRCTRPEARSIFLITLDDEKSGARIGDAEVAVEVTDPHGRVDKKPLLHTQSAAFPTTASFSCSAGPASTRSGSPSRDLGKADRNAVQGQPYDLNDGRTSL